MLRSIDFEEYAYTSREEKSKEDWKTLIASSLIESDENERIRKLFRMRLIECGWHNHIKEKCRELILHRGISNVSVDGIVKELLPHGRDLVPDQVKRELVEQIKIFISSKESV